jgi:hypothetical protein
MTAYKVSINVSISPKSDSYSPSGSLFYSKEFSLEGETFSDIAARIDKLYAAIGEGLAVEAPPPVVLPRVISGPSPEMWDAALLTCPYCHCLVASNRMTNHDAWHMMIARLLKQAGVEIEIRT